MDVVEHTETPDRGAVLELPRVLVVGTDLTAADQRVSTIAVRLAVILEAAVNLVHVLDTGSGDGAGPGDSNDAAHRAHSARVRQRVEDGRELLEAERVRVAAIDRDGHAVIRVTLADGPPWETIVRVARELRRAWLVVGASAGVARSGRTSDSVLRHTAVPVLVVPEGCADALLGPVVVAVDGSARTTGVLAAGAQLARALGRPLEVFHAHSALDLGAPERITLQLRDVPDDVATSRALRPLAPSSSIAEAIADHARTISASILVVGAGVHGEVAEGLGNTAAALVNTSPVPVLVVR